MRCHMVVTVVPAVVVECVVEQTMAAAETKCHYARHYQHFKKILVHFLMNRWLCLYIHTAQQQMRFI